MNHPARPTLLLTAFLIVGLTAAVPASAADDRKGNRNGDRVFYLAGTAQQDTDPENPKNQVIRLTSVFDPNRPAAAQVQASKRPRPTRFMLLRDPGRRSADRR